jgi:hypothetical protein
MLLPALLELGIKVRVTNIVVTEAVTVLRMISCLPGEVLINLLLQLAKRGLHPTASENLFMNQPIGLLADT